MSIMQSSIQTLSQRFVGFNDAYVFCLANIRSATSVYVLPSPDLARHCCWHRNFQLSRRILFSFFELRIRWINEVNTAQSSSVVKLGFFDSPLWFFLFFALLLTCLSISLATSNLAWMLFASVSTALRTMYTHLEVVRTTR